MATELPKIIHLNQLCESFLVSKQTRLPFPTQTSVRAERPLQLVHAYLCGPITTSSIAGNKYFILLVDDYSHWMWVYMLKEKGEALCVFQKFKRLTENESNHYRLRWRVIIPELKFCEKEGIKRQLTAPYTPIQNGVVERRNRTIMNTTKNLVMSIQVSTIFWGEAIQHAAYLLIRLPTKVLDTHTPYEAWFGKRSHFEYLRVFVCTIHVKTTKPYIKKLMREAKRWCILAKRMGPRHIGCMIRNIRNSCK